MNHIGENVTIFDDVVLGDNITIENNCYIDHHCIIRDNVTIKEGSIIGANSIIGEYLADFYDDRKNKEHPLVIGKNAIIRSGTIIYGDSVIGDNFQTGHRVTIRENSQIGNNVLVGTLSDIQGCCVIEDYVNMHSNVFIGEKAHIKKYAWIFPHCVLTNDSTPPSDDLEGVTIEEYAIVSAGSKILPGKTIGRNALVGAGSVVTRNVGEMDCVVGNPAKQLCKVNEIKNKKGEDAYPWPLHFDRRTPWEKIGYNEWLKNEKGHMDGDKGKDTSK